MKGNQGIQLDHHLMPKRQSVCYYLIRVITRGQMICQHLSSITLVCFMPWRLRHITTNAKDETLYGKTGIPFQVV